MSTAQQAVPAAPTGLAKAAASPAAHSSKTFVAPSEGARLDLDAAQSAGIIDKEIFGQLLEMDEDDEHSFSKPLVEEYIEQAETTLTQIKSAMESDMGDVKLLELLSSRGHFLKGSSAALGLVKVRESCELLQNFGKRKDREGKDLEPKKALQECRLILTHLHHEQQEANFWLKALCNIP